MRYQVVGVRNGIAYEIDTKDAMDDALDLIKAMEDFDKAENMNVYDEYQIKRIKD